MKQKELSTTEQMMGLLDKLDPIIDHEEAQQLGVNIDRGVLTYV
ncbi:hypothetical protein [Paenibacillus selenitireducens]|nr:hypothetical protein [Paenibacillus selenitireducens]